MRSMKAVVILVFVILFAGNIFTDNSPRAIVHDDLLDNLTLSEESMIIVFDMSHGQYNYPVFVDQDAWLEANLTYLGYTVVWAWGGLNATILDGAIGLVIGAIYGTDNGFTLAEISAITDWFNSGDKLLWVGSDSDYAGYNYINSNASAILEAVGSHVYPEPASIEDPDSNCGAAYRAVANRTSDNQFLLPAVNGVSNVLFHGPTLLYGSNSSNPGFGVEPVALESISIENVYPLLYYSEAATIIDSDLIPPLAHSDGVSGSYVATTMETNLGNTNSSIVVVSGASPYASYKPMSTSYYFDRHLEGDLFVRQLIDYGIKLLTGLVVTSPDDFEYEEGVTGYSIEWGFFGPQPKNYSILLDDVVIRKGLCNSSAETITITVDGLSVGIFNYTIQIHDYNNNTKSDTVFVTVSEPLVPTINHPEDFVYYVGQNESIINWFPDDLSLYYYELFKNDSLILTHYWVPNEPTSVTLNVGNLPVGMYNYTIHVFDKLMQSVSDTVIVQVLPVITTTTTTVTTTVTVTTTGTNTTTQPFNLIGNLTLIISLGSVIVILTVVVIIFRNRN